MNILISIEINSFIHCKIITKYKKISSVDYIKNFGGSRITYFVPQKGQLKEKKYITQLMGNYKSIYYDELMNLRSELPVIIAGDENAPDKFVNDWDILSNTSLLVHHKEYGSCCNSVMKALDCGIPIYMTRENRYKLGFEDVPEYCFIFSDHCNIKDAYIESKLKNNKTIQEEFRRVKSLENCTKELKQLLEI